MAVLGILEYPDPRLREVAAPIAPAALADAAFQQWLDDLVETMYASHGVGLAAPQVGAPRRVCVVDCGRRAPSGELDGEWQPDLLVLVNPRITEAEGELTWKEGCLSVPGVSAEVQRAQRVVVEHLDRAGTTCRLEGTGLLAVCLQHELDHLDGRLYVDRLPPLEQKLVLQDYERLRAAPPTRPVDPPADPPPSSPESTSPKAGPSPAGASPKAV